MSDEPRGTRDLTYLWLIVSVVGIVAGGIAWLAGSHDAADAVWGVTTAVGLVPLAWTTVVGLIKREAGVDLIALLAMAGSLALGEYLAGAVIAVMLASGRALETYADRRAHRELSALLDRAPQMVTRYEDGELVVRPIDDVRPGDRLFVKTGEVVPVDGVLMSAGVFDESALTGESRPSERPDGDPIRSGAVNAGSAVDLRAVSTAAESTYAGIVRLVTEAEKQKAPFVRVADRYAVIFIPVTLVIAGAAWLLSGDPVRALSVLVVATPCPLILAVPIAVVAGISRAARRGIIVKGGGALETLAHGKVLLFDKTGTLTAGIPQVADVEVFDDMPADELLRLSASLDQVSPHVLATSIVRAAREHGVVLTFPTDVIEQHGAGIEGTVDGRHVALGKASFVSAGAPMPRRARDVRRRTALDGSSCVFVAVDAVVTGALVIDDPIRPDSPRVIRTLRRAGINRVVMVTGDHPDVAESVGAALGVDRVLSERDPAEKVKAVEAEREEGVTIFVGDGLNDAPALAAADVGVAMGARGATASSEAADVVLVVDRLDRIADAISIARRSRRIAEQSVVIGMGLAFGGMLLGAFGLLVPVAGAIVQECIDVFAILNALRALRGEKQVRRVSPSNDVADRFRFEHKEFAPEVLRIRTVADRLGQMTPDETRQELEAVRVLPVGAPPRARGGGGGDRLPGRRRSDGRRGSDVEHEPSPPGDRPPRADIPTARRGAAGGRTQPGGPDGPAARPVRAARDPAPALRAGRGGLRLAGVGRRRPVGVGARVRARAEVRRSARLPFRHRRAPIGGLGPVAGGMVGKEDAERRSAARALLDPRPAVVQLGEARDEREPHADARQVRRRGLALEERLEDLLALIGRHAGAVVLDDDQRAALPRLDAHPDPRRRRRVLDRVAQQVLDDPLDLRPVARDDDGRGLHVHLAVGEELGVGDELPDEGAHVGRPEQRLDDAARQPVEIEQVRHEPVEPPGVLGDPARQVAHLVVIEMQVLARHRDGETQDPGERRPEVVRDGLQERVLHLVDDAEALRRFSFQRSGRVRAPGRACAP